MAFDGIPSNIARGIWAEGIFLKVGVLQKNPEYTIAFCTVGAGWVRLVLLTFVPQLSTISMLVS